MGETDNRWSDRAVPMRIDERTRIVLASALATKVSWSVPLEVVPAEDHLGVSSPWRGRVGRLLWDERPGLIAKLVLTRAAGLVAVHCAAAVEGVTVVSVSAEPGLSRAVVLDAVHDVLAQMRAGWPASMTCSLLELPVGLGHSWQISEREIPTPTAGERVELISGASLPAWRVESQLDFKRSELFGSEAALNALRELIGPRPDDETVAGQAAVASFTRFGFETAAITFFGIAISASREPLETGVERSATLRFDHPYAAVAVAGNASALAGDDQPESSFTSLPLFTAWIDTPEEPEDDPDDD